MTRRLPLIEKGPRPTTLASESRPIDRSCRPMYCVWEVTLRCDLACAHCGSRAGHAREGELSTAECLDLIAQLADLGVQEVSLIGGEAYLRDDWLDLVRAVVGHGMECGIVTGGRGMTRERAKAAADAGVDSMSVSVDGLADTHDVLRAWHGSHDAALRAIDNVQEAGMGCAANTQINALNLHQIDDLATMLLARGIYAWQVQFTVAMGRAADRPDVLLEPYQMLETMPLVARLAERCKAQDVVLWAGNNVGYFGPHEDLLRGDMEHGHTESCTAGRLTLGIEANGDIKGCPSLPSRDYVGGNIRQASLRDIWERSEPLRFTRGRTVDDLWGYCRDCYYAPECLAGCTWTSHVLFGRRGNNPYCHHRALELLRVGERERLELAEKAPGDPFDFGRYRLIREAWPEAERERAQAVVDGRAARLLSSEP